MAIPISSDIICSKSTRRRIMVKLETCDVILWKNIKSDPISQLSRWAIGPYSHVAMYIKRFEGVPMVYESRGRGVVIASLLSQTGMPVAVMRPLFHLIKLCHHYSPQTFIPLRSQLLKTAFEIAADEKSFYDYFCIMYSCIPRILKEKFPWLPLPVKYHRDIFMICSEAVAEIFWQNEVDVISEKVVPLPGDFAESLFLKYVGEGKLMEDIVP